MAADILSRIGQQVGHLFEKTTIAVADDATADQKSRKQPPLLDFLYKFDKDSTAENVFQGLEKQTRLRREQLVTLLVSIIAVYMAVGTLPRLVFHIIGVLYPICASVKAIRTDQKSLSQWLIYWSNFGTFIIADSLIFEPIFSGFTLYWLAKAIFVLYLVVPQTNGSKEFFDKVVSPLVVRIDGSVAQLFSEWQKNHKSLAAELAEEQENS